MLIYSKNNGKIICTAVQLSAGRTIVTHSSYIWEKHKSAVNKLQDNGDVYVTGGTYSGAVYSGKMEPRDKFSQYLKD